MERVLSQDERIRRAEELYARRKMQANCRTSATVNVEDVNTNKITKKQASAIGLNKIKFAVSSDDFYYFVGTDANNNCKVVKVDPVTYQYEYLLSDGEYDVYNLSINKNSIVFNALRMSDGAIVMGRINNNGNIKILDDKLESQVTVLERIN